METRELISIIVPAYNAENYIEKCLNSILSQTYSSIEVIVVNDGSTDRTKEIVEQYTLKDSRVILISTENQGVSLARKEGIHRAKGKYIGFVDSDDCMDSDMYEVLVNNMTKYEADIAHCGYKMYFEDGRTHYFYNTNQIKIQDCETGLIDLLEGKIIEPGLWNKLYKKKLLDKMLLENKMNFKIRQTEDLLMNYILFSYAEKSVFVDVCKYHYMIRSGSATRSGLNINMIEDPIKVKKLILDMSKGKVRCVAEKMYISTLINSYNAIMLNGDGKYVENVKRISRELIDNNEFIKGLPRKTKLLYTMILYCPFFYRTAYRIYYNYFLNKRYE